MIMAYKIITGKVSLKKEDIFTFASSQRNRRSHQYKLAKKKATKLVRQNALSVRVVDDWNGLPKDVVSAESINSFKQRLDAHWGPAEMYKTPF